MIKKYIVIVLGNKALQKCYVEGQTDSECHDRAFEWADTVLGPNKDYELYDLGHPRHQVLFEEINEQIFKSIKN